MQAVAVEKLKMHIVLTNSARDAIKQHVQDEHAFFNCQKAFIVYIEKLEHDGQQLHVTLYFDGVKNKGLAKQFPDRIIIMDCLFDAKSGLVAKSFRTKSIHTPVATNRRARLLVQLIATRINGHTYPEKFLKALKELPFSKERYEYVNKRITSWEGYLKVLNKNADFDDIDTQFTKHTINSTFTHITLHLPKVESKKWKQLDGLSARVKGYHTDLGKVVKVKRGEQLVEIELTHEMARLARRQQLHFDYRDISFSNAATKSQLRRLLKGFERLKEGLAANPNLEKMLFEDNIVLAPPSKTLQLEFHNRLNEYQQAAVQGAMDTDDLYVIQGPPGTGKTTVISEICYQNAKLGLKTLVASQSNLAVDNALGRLLSNKDIRILRYGRTESIEEEGKKFIEENVGDYWKQQTYDAIAHEVNNHPKQAAQIEQQMQHIQRKLDELISQIEACKQRFDAQQLAKQQIKQLMEEMKQLKKTVDEDSGHLSDAMTAHDKLLVNEKTLKASYEEALLQRNKCRTIQQIELDLDDESANGTKLANELDYIQQKASYDATADYLQRLHAQKEKLQPDDTLLKKREEEISTLKKVSDVEDYLVKHDIRRSFVMGSLLNVLTDRQERLKEYVGVKPTYEHLKQVVELVKPLHISFEKVILPTNHSYNVFEVQEFLRKVEDAVAAYKLTASNGSRTMQGLHLRQQYIENEMIQYQALVNDTMTIFNKLKEELFRLFEEQKHTSSEALQPLERDIEQTEASVVALKQTLQTFAVVSERNKQQVEFEIYASKQNVKALKLELAQTKERLALYEQLHEQFEQLTAVVEASKLEIDTITARLNAVTAERTILENKVKELQVIVDEPIEQQLEALNDEYKKYEAELEIYEDQLQRLPLIQSLQKQWLAMLETATLEDVDEIRKLYVKHANVIGTTCVTSANKEFMENYPNFDVVIIDEVSKATPPELLLPMLKGAKIILVGDHHQLPPLIGDDTLEETLEQVMKESDSFEERKELEKLLEESLFERLYRNLGPSNKKMLAIQYRMHEKIMETIAPFYKQEQDELTCGLENSDEVRDHMLEAETFNRSNHLMWYDIPLSKAYGEQRLKEGASLFNEAELHVVKKLLVELNAATKLAIEEGRLPLDTKKSVGVISFYAEQVKRINRLIEQEIDVPFLHIRTGSVDKFQGMEMDVILVSMVRNHEDPRGAIGFAKDYRRLNVALSRARELLMLVGASELFAQRTKKDVKQMYQHVLTTVQQQDGYRNCEQGGYLQ